MNIPFEVSATYSGTPIVKKLFDSTDNLLLAAIHTALAESTFAASLAKVGITLPTAPFFVESFVLSVDAASKLDLGYLITAGSVFVPLFTGLLTSTTTGGTLVRQQVTGPLNLHDGTARHAAIRVTGVSNGTIRVAGDLGIYPRP